MATEIELKLLVTVRYLPSLREALKQRVGGEKAKRRRLLSHYFDTSTFQLWKNQIALRVRRVDRRWVQTLKGGGRVHAGIHQRAEWETPVEASRPDLDALTTAFPDDRELQRLIKELPGQDDIQAIFSTDIHREAFILALSEGCEVEAAIDEGEVVFGGQRKPISELEIELKSGDNPVPIFDLARELLKVAPFTIGVVSKAERGYSLARQDANAVPRRAQSVSLDPSTTVEDAFVAIFSECLGHLLENMDGFVVGPGVEYLHQMRVAIRRFRAALTLFGNVVPKSVLAGVATNLQSAGRILGEARNWDVLRDESLPAYANDAHVAFSAEFTNRVQRNARRATANARRFVRTRRLTDLLLEIASCILGRTWRHTITETTFTALAEPVAAPARSAINKRWRQLKKCVVAVQPENPATLHAVRIAAKKLRYSMQFFASLFPKKSVQSHLQQLADIQGLLGRLNDFAIADKLLMEAMADSPALMAEVVAMRVWCEAQGRSDQRQFMETWERFAKRSSHDKKII